MEATNIRPDHYGENDLDIGISCIEAMEVLYGPKATYDFCVLNAFKYLWRHKSKFTNPNNQYKDLNKANTYLSIAGDITNRHKDMLHEEDVRRIGSMYDLIQTKMDEVLSAFNPNSSDA